MSAPPAATLHRRMCYFTGRVQGVGFRYTVQNIALQHNVLGYVRNLPDGRVELIMEGPDGEMDQLLDDVKDRMSPYIRDVKMDSSPPTGEFTRFCIKH
jgi:acylphosphatase